MRFYVYELRDECGVPFYVGKGSGRRLHIHERRARAGYNSHCANKIRLILRRGGKVSTAVVFETDDEHAAFAEERRLIALYGRATLTNKTDGGDGVSNPPAEARAKIAAARRGVVASEATREKQRAAKLGKPRSAETRAKIAKAQRGSKHPWAVQPKGSFKGRKHSPETIEKMRAAKRGHVVSPETRRKISEAKRRKT